MQRHRVNERAVGAIALVGALVASVAGASPTGSAPIDALLVGAAVALATWAGGTAPWWTISIVAVAATALSTSWLTVSIGVAALAASWWVGERRRDLSVERSLIVAVSCALLVRSGVDGFHGMSALLGVGAAVPVVVFGLRRRRTGASRSIAIGLAGLGVAAVAVTALTGLAAATARTDLADGQTHATAGITAVQRGDYLDASASFRLAAEEFDAAHDALSTPWARAGSAVPVVSQNHRAATDLSARAATASEALSNALAVVDPEQLRLEGGRIDLDVVAILTGPFETIRSEVAALDEAIAAIDSPWLLGPIDRRLDDLRTDLAANRDGLVNAVDALTLAPQLLGAQEERRYFVAVTTPAEARGIAGFMGSWLELSAVDGRLEVVRSGRTLDLNRAGLAERRVSGPADWLTRYGRFGFDSGPDGTTAADPWSNITLSPDFASTAQVIAELYPQSGGTELDGVFSLDPEVISALLAYTGPIGVAGTDVVLDSSNVVEFLLVGQYETSDDGERVDLLENVSAVVVSRLLGGELPNPTIVARDLGPLAREGRLLGWSPDAAEQELFRSVGLAAELPTLDGGDGVGVVFTNVGANKLDPYLGRRVSYRSTVDPETGVARSTLVVTVINDAPTSGFPDGVIGNYLDDPIGTNRTRMSVYSALPVVGVEVDGTAASTRQGAEGDWTVNSLTLALAPGSTVAVTFEFEGSLPAVAALGDGGQYRLVTFTQPLVLDEAQSITVNDEAGRELIAEARTATGVNRLVGADPALEGNVSR